MVEDLGLSRWSPRFMSDLIKDKLTAGWFWPRLASFLFVFFSFGLMGIRRDFLWWFYQTHLVVFFKPFTKQVDDGWTVLMFWVETFFSLKWIFGSFMVKNYYCWPTVEIRGGCKLQVCFQNRHPLESVDSKWFPLEILNKKVADVFWLSNHFMCCWFVQKIPWPQPAVIDGWC